MQSKLRQIENMRIEVVRILKEDYNWREAFNYANGFSLDDVKNIIALDEGENDGESWVIVVELNDGKFGYVDAWCDYTGWDCCAGGSSAISETFEHLQRFELTSKIRRRLNMTLPDLDEAPVQYGI